MNVLKHRSGSHRLLCGVLAALTATGPATAAMAQEQALPVEAAAQQRRVEGAKALIADPADAPPKLDLQYVLPNAAVVVALRPGRILDSKAVALLPIEIVQAAMVKELGIDPLAAEQVVVSAAPPMQGPPSYAVHAKFSQPVALAESNLVRDMEESTFDGKTFFRAAQAMEPSLYQPDENSLLAAPEFALPALTSPPAVTRVNPLLANVIAADRGDDLLAMVDVAALRPLIFMGLAQADVPVELQQFLQVPNLVKLIELRVNLSRPGASELILTANNEDDAERLTEMFDDAKKMIADQMAGNVQEMLASDDPVEQASGRYSQRMVKVWDERLQLVREGDQIVLLRTDLSGAGGNELTMMATIGVLAGLLLPAVQAAREAARRNQSMNNLKQVMLGLLNYESAHANYGDDGKPLLSWRVHTLPYMEQQALYEQFHLDEPWDSDHNKELIPLMPEIFLDPSSGLPLGEGRTHYLGVAGDGRIFDGTEEGRQIKTVTDGLSNTIALVQVGDQQAVTWTKPDDYEPEGENPLADVGSLRPGGFLTGFSDGSVRFISEEIDVETFQAMLTVAGDEVVNLNE